MARLTSETKEQILADFHTGKSQNQLAKDYEVSKSTINAICKGVTPKFKELVEQKANTEIAVKKGLATASERETNAFNNAVRQKVDFASLIHNSTARAIERINTLLESSDSVADHAMAIKAFDTASLTLKVNERHAPKAEIKAEANAQANTLVITRKELGSNE